MGEIVEPAPADVAGSDGEIDEVGDQFSGIGLVAGSFGVNYNFAEQIEGGSVSSGQAATIGFWQNRKGQALIESLNGSADSTLLASWMADTFPNMYGVLDDPDNDPTTEDTLTNQEVATTYKHLFKRNNRDAPGGPPKLDAQVMAVVFASYATKKSLSGLKYDSSRSTRFEFDDANSDGLFNLADGDSAALNASLISQVESYGFEVTTGGLGSSKFNVGDGGEAFGVADNDEVRVIDLLLATDARSYDGLLYDIDRDGSIDPTEESLRVLANDVFSAINEQGAI